MSFEWDPNKDETNFKKHGIRFAEAESVLADDFAVTIADNESDPDEQRFVSIGMGPKGKVLLVVYCYRETNIRIISARSAESHECAEYKEQR